MHKRNDDIATEKDEWSTPDNLFQKLNDEFNFDCDAAATAKNTKLKHFFGEDYTGQKEDALKMDWLRCSFQDGILPTYPNKFFLNPPYSDGMLEKFMKKAYVESLKGAMVVCLVPFSGAGWFKRWCMRAYEIRIVGRVRFVGYKKDGTVVRNTPPFDSCVVIFDVNMKKKWFEKNPNVIFPFLGVF